MLKYAPELQDADIVVTPSGVTGPDLLLSPLASKSYPFVFEAKNVEALNVWKALAQAESHGKNPLLVFKRNRSPLYVALDFEFFLKLLKGAA